MQTHRPPSEIRRSALEAWHPGISDNEYRAARRKTHDEAVAAIKDFAGLCNSSAPLALLRIAASMSAGTEADMISALAELLDVSDPDDFDGAVDTLRKAVDAHEDTYGEPL